MKKTEAIEIISNYKITKEDVENFLKVHKRLSKGKYVIEKSRNNEKYDLFFNLDSQIYNMHITNTKCEMISRDNLLSDYSKDWLFYLANKNDLDYKKAVATVYDKEFKKMLDDKLKEIKPKQNIR